LTRRYLQNQDERGIILLISQPYQAMAPKHRSLFGKEFFAPAAEACSFYLFYPLAKAGGNPSISD
jgi:hypothetical protein